MPMAQIKRDRLRGALLGPLGQEATDMLMEELDQAGLRDHVDMRFAEIDERFAEQDRHIDERFAEQDRKFGKRFDEVDKRFERVEGQLAALTTAVIDLSRVISESTRPGNAIVYTVCGTFALVSLTALVTTMLQVFRG